MKLSFVIPCYRSEGTIRSVVDEIINIISLRLEYDYEIILVNDCSPDQVWSVIKTLAKENIHIKGISLSQNFGQHSALLAGYAQCTGDYVVSLDDDGQTPVEGLFRLIEKVEEGYDVVYAYYREIKQNVFRRFGSWVARVVSEKMIESPKGFKGSSFFVARKFVIEEIIKYKHPYPFISGLIFRTTKNITNIETEHRKRLQGKSGYSINKLFSLWMNEFTSFSVKPLELGVYMGFLMSFFGFVYAIVIIVRKLLGVAVQSGWSSIISLILIIGGVILIMLGLLGEYVGRIYICINNAPQYVIKEMTISNNDEYPKGQ
ncbi:glycosyltransferase [Lachnospiraceae bacterium]|nr:glycosyltransferase [Lachnospiraceae bacterium]